MAEEQAGERTEAPTQRRLQRARTDGQVAISREITSLASLGAGLVALLMSWERSGDDLMMSLRALIALAGTSRVEPADLEQLIEAVGLTVLRLLVPVMLAGIIAAYGAGLLQTGLAIRPIGKLVDAGRLDPRAHLKRMVGREAALEAVKALAKLACFGYAVTIVVRGDLVRVGAVSGLSAFGVASVLGSMLLHAVLIMGGVQLAIAGLDYGVTRARHHRRLRMSRQELRDEHKDTEGDPHVRQRIRALRRRRSRQRMMLAVPRAAVVLTNPTHYAVALAYENGSRSAPKVVAKGADEVAARIRALAREHRIPLVENKPLARALFTVPLEAEIPREHFQAVAAVIAHVWRLAERAKARSTG